MPNIIKAIKHPGKAVKDVLDTLLSKYAFLIKNDEKYIRLKWWLNMDYPLNLDNPQTFSEKLQWLKLNDHNPLYTTMVDKVAVKDYVASILGKEYIIPTLGVYDKPEDINWVELPDRFVLKCTNDSNSVVICKNKSKLDKEKVIKKYRRALKHNYFYKGREWPYKNVPRQIIAEAFIDPQPESKDLRDYKFFCFNGEVKMFKIDFDRFVRHRANYYSPKGDLLKFGEVFCPPDYERIIDLPQEISQMKELAENLSKDIPFVRIDFYLVKSQILFGEMTFYPAGGIGRYTSTEWDREIGSWLKLPPRFN